MNEYTQNESETFSDLTSATMTSTTFVKPEISKSEVSMATKTPESVVSMATDLYVSDDCGKQETSDIFSMAASIFYQDNGDPTFSSGLTYEPNYVYLSNVDISVQGHDQQGSQQFCQNESVNSINFQYPGNNSSSDEQNFGGQISQNFISPSSQNDSYSGSYGNDVASSNQSGMFNQGCDSNGTSQGQGHNLWSFNPGFIHSYGNGIRSSDMNQQQEFWMQGQQSFSGNMGFGGHLPFDNGGLNFSANMNQNLPPFSQIQSYGNPGNPFGGNVAGYGIVPGQQSVPAFSENERSFNPSFVPNSSPYPIPPNGGTGKNEGKTSSDSPKSSQRSRNSDSDKPYDCTNCGKSFKSEWSLKRHALVHSGEKPYKCNMCDQRYARSDKLRSHLRIHNVIDTKIDIKAFRDITRTRTSKKARKDSQQIQSVTDVSQNNVTCSDGSAQVGPLPNFSQVFSPPETVASKSELATTRGGEVQNNNTINSDNFVLPSEESFSLKEEISRKEDDLQNTGKVKDMSWHDSDSRNGKSVIGIENKTKTEVFLKTNAENPAQGSESSCPSQNKGQTMTVAGTRGESFLLSIGCDSISAIKMQSDCRSLSAYVPEKNESSCSSNSGGCELPNDKNLIHSLANSTCEAKKPNKMKNAKEEQDQHFQGKYETINNATFVPLERNTNQEVEKSSIVKVETDIRGGSQKHESVIKIIQEVIGKINQESGISTRDEHLEPSVFTKGLTLHEIDKNSTHIENDLGRHDPDGVQNSCNSNELGQNNFNSLRNAINLLGPKKINNPDAQENIIKQPNEKCINLCYDQECTRNPHFVMQVLTDKNKYVPEMKMMSQQNNREAGVNPVTQSSVNTLSFGLGLLNPESIGNPDFGLDMLSEHDINNAESELGLTAQQNETDLDSGFGLFHQQGIENSSPRYVMLNPDRIDEADSGFSGITQENEIKTIMKTFDLNPAEIMKVHAQYPPSDPNSLCKSLGSVKTIDQTQTKKKKSTSSKKRKKDDKKDEEKQNSAITSADDLDDGSIVKDRGETKMPRKRKAKEAHSCDVCGRLFTQKGSVIRHQLVHSGEKPFECDVCSIKFARIDNLRAHKKTHGIFESWNPNQKGETVTMNMDKRRSKRHGRSDVKKINSAQIMDLKAQKEKCDEYKTGQQCDKFEIITGENQEVHPDIVTISTAINYEAGHFNDFLVNETKTGNNLKELNLSHRHKELSQQITHFSSAETNKIYQTVVEKSKSKNIGSVKNNQVVGHRGNAVKKRKKDAKKKLSVRENWQKFDLEKKINQNHRAVKQSKEVLREIRTERSVTEKNLKKSGNVCHCGPNEQSLGLSIIWQKSYICSVCHASFVNLCSTWNHMFLHTKQDSSKCEICSEKFQSAQKLKCHLLKHISRGKARHKCVYCGFDSQSSRGFKNLRAARKCTSEIKYASRKQKQFLNSMKVAEASCYKCKLCGKRFLWLSYLRFHLLGHKDRLSIFGKTWRKKKVKFVRRSQGGKVTHGNKISHKTASQIKREKKS